MDQIYSKVLDYLQEKVSNFVIDKRKQFFTCPSCLEMKCNFMTKSYRLFCLGCNQRIGDIVDVVRLLEQDKKDNTTDEILYYLKDKYKVNVLTETEITKAFELYEQNGFDLVPLLNGRKIPLEKDWLNKEHRDVTEWRDWLKDRLNIGIKTGSKSNITVLDIDTKIIDPALLKLLTPTLTQESFKGYHYFYLYESSLPTTRIEELTMDILNDGKQVVVFPSSVDAMRRIIPSYSTPIAKMPPELVSFLQSYLTTPPNKTFSERLQNEPAPIDLSLTDVQSVNEGNRHNILLRMGGILRKELNHFQTGYALNMINNAFCRPKFPPKELSILINSLDKYINFDEQELALKVLNYLKIVQDGTARDVKEALGETKERIDKALAYLVKEEYIIKKRREYHIIKKVAWKDTFMEDGKPLGVNVPYFHDVAIFRSGDMIVIGGQQKVGKSHIAMNIIKQLVEQGKKPYYINLESGNRFTSIARTLGLKDGDFFNATHFTPEEVELEREAITIIDWLLPKDYAETDKLYQYFAHQLSKNGGLLIIFVQLKENGDFFAKNMIAMFPALVCRYFYEKASDGTDIPTEGKFSIDYVREPKTKMKKGYIPCHYDWDSKRLIPHTPESLQKPIADKDGKFLNVTTED